MRDDILEHAVTQPDEYVGEIMKRSIPEIDIKGSLADAWSQMDKSSLAVVAVTRDNHFVGLLAYDRLADFLLLQELKHRMPKEDDIEWTNP
jgi:predicted transcriptional regulator